jgi:hypothetical protein
MEQSNRVNRVVLIVSFAPTKLSAYSLLKLKYTGKSYLPHLASYEIVTEEIFRVIL